jgi:hypothetical protein
MTYPAFAFWALVVWSVFAPPTTVLILLLGSMPFASLALVPPEYVGGMSILPQSMFAGVLIVKVLLPHVLTLSPKLMGVLRLRELGCLALFLVTGILATFIMPRLYAGEVVVVPMHYRAPTELLASGQSNFTQTGYVVLSIMTVFAVALIAEDSKFIKALLLGMVVGGSVCIATGLLDIIAAASGVTRFLEPFRNAGYAFLINSEVGGMRRVVGLAPEASTYGGMCVVFASILALLRHLYPAGRQQLLATVAALCLAILAIYSTSSTAYVGLAVLGAVYSANWIRRVFASSEVSQSGLLLEFLAGVGLAIGLLIIFVVRPDLLDPLTNLVQEVIFNKPLTTSFYERSQWNSVAWESLWSTGGLGIGFGSTRTSNWFAAIVSNSGLIGAAFMGAFLAVTLFRRCSWRTQMTEEMLPALKLSLAPALAMAALATSGPDFGPWVAVVLGAIAGVAALRPLRSAQTRASSAFLAERGSRATA